MKLLVDLLNKTFLVCLSIYAHITCAAIYIKYTEPL